MNFKIVKNVKNKNAPALVENKIEFIKNKTEVDELIKRAKKKGEICLKYVKGNLEYFLLTIENEDVIITYGGKNIEL